MTPMQAKSSRALTIVPECDMAGHSKTWVAGQRSGDDMKVGVVEGEGVVHNRHGNEPAGRVAIRVIVERLISGVEPKSGPGSTKCSLGRAADEMRRGQSTDAEAAERGVVE